MASYVKITRRTLVDGEPTFDLALVERDDSLKGATSIGYRCLSEVAKAIAIMLDSPSTKGITIDF